MTGCTLSGNKVRKLEFLMAEALTRKCSHVITCGDVHSNHCRATAVAARQLGLKPHLLLRTDLQEARAFSCEGNALLTRLCGPDIYLVPQPAPYKTHLRPRMEELATSIKEKTGEDSCLIPVGGGAGSPGIFGIISVFEEMISQGLLDDYDDLVFACASGCTAAGTGISNYLTGSHIRCHAVIVCNYTKTHFLDQVDQTLYDIGLSDNVKAVNIVDIIEGHQGKGYSESTQEEHDFVASVAESTGIMLDLIYTGKATLGMLWELNNNPGRFKGNRILFLHTGGMFGMYDGRLDTTIIDRGHNDNKIHMWSSTDSLPEQNGHTA
ncbi:bifunctional D-cysteine desulfhydrase/1-aminocyclopropane-1-carboxylate deaminase, mitochondrial-like [Mizuhopecten yessoensis]|nr:bifunctional D-cysteine desulfhydrase/1-aminocyclopropane-1-carboxylate deaminase, mitochondrial-like [Mizuhopecten yessoensis]